VREEEACRNELLNTRDKVDSKVHGRDSLAMAPPGVGPPPRPHAHHYSHCGCPRLGLSQKSSRDGGCDGKRGSGFWKELKVSSQDTLVRFETIVSDCPYIAGVSNILRG